MSTDRFPLRRLPTNASKNVLRVMDGDQLISYSLISKDTKQNVKELQWKFRSFFIKIGPKLELILVDPQTYRIALSFNPNQIINWNPEENEPLDNSEIVLVKYRKSYGREDSESMVLLNRGGLSVREWIHHLLCIFNYSTQVHLSFTGESTRFNAVFIKKSIENLNIRHTSFHQLPLDASYKLMIETGHFPEGLFLESDLIPVKYLHKTVIQNLGYIGFRSRNFVLNNFIPEATVPFRINDILANSAKHIYMNAAATSDKDLNRFLKLWIKGSNPQLNHMRVENWRGRRKDKAVIMKGIRHQVTQDRQERQRSSRDGLRRKTFILEGSSLIWRTDGVEATIYFDTWNKSMQFTNAPIKKDIVGDWTLVSSTNTEAYLAERNLGEFFNTAFLSYDQSFLVNCRQVSQLHVIGDEILGQLHERIGYETRRPLYTRKTTVQEEGTILRTMETWLSPQDKVVAAENENRFVKDGLLYVINQTKKLVDGKLNSTSCTRVYRKIKEAESQETVRTEFNGTWRPIANSRLEEYCAIMKIDKCTKKLMEHGHVALNILSFFNEIHCNLFIPYTPFEQKSTGQLDKDYNGFVTSFRGNQLVTVGFRFEIVRIVKNGKLFVTNFKDGISYMVVYEKV